MKSNKQIEKLKPNLLDSTMTVSKMIANMFPGAGSLVEGIGFLVGGQRIDRACTVLESIITKVDELSHSVNFIKKLHGDEEYEYIFSELINEAAKPGINNKKEYIKNLLIKGLDNASKEIIYNNMFTRLISDLSEREILYLAKFVHYDYPNQIKTYSTYEQVFEGLEDDFLYHQSLEKIYISNLISKGLLFKEEPRFSEYIQRLEYHDPEITDLGELFIKYIWNESQ